MSELENLAEQVRRLGQDGNSAMHLAAAMNREINTLNTSLASLSHLRELSGLREGLDALNLAQRRTAEAASQLHALQSGADAFADYLVGANGGPTGATNSTGPSPTAHATFARTNRTFDEIFDALEKFNPPGGLWDAPKEYLKNCGNVAANVFDFLNGDRPLAAPTGTLSISEMNARTGMVQTQMTSDEIIAALKRSGPGSHAVVGLDRLDDEDGHWINVLYDGHNVLAIDAQGYGGVIKDFPPSNETRVMRWDISMRLGDR